MHFRFFQWFIRLSFILPFSLFRNHWGNSDWKGPQEVSTLTLCSEQGQLRDQTALPKASSSGLLKTSKDRDSATSPCNLCRCRLSLRRKVLLAPALNLFLEDVVPCPPMGYCCVKHGSVFSITFPVVGSRGCCYVPPKPSLLQAGRVPFLSFFSQGK